MKNKWNIIVIAVIMVLASVILPACTANNEPEEPTHSTVSDKPLEYDTDYAEDDEIIDDESSEEILDGHEEETVIDEVLDEIPEE